MTIEFEIETASFEEAPAGCSIKQGHNVVFNNMIALLWQLAELGAEMPRITLTDWRKAKLSFLAENDALAFKLLCNRKILNEHHL